VKSARYIEPLERRCLCAASLDALGAVPPLGPSFTYLPQLQGKIIYVNPGQRIGDALDKANPGDHVVVRAGTYHESITITRSGTPTRPIVLRAETPGAVTLDASGNTTALLAGDGCTDVFISGLIISGTNNTGEGNHNAAVRIGDHWTIQDCTIQNNAGGGLGVFGDGVVVRRVTAQDNGRFGIGGSSCINLLVQDCISRRNNRSFADSNGGGGKFTRVEHGVFQRNLAYENGGPGLWLDVNNIHVTVTGCDFYDNRTVTSSGRTASGDGIDIEVSGTLVRSVSGKATEIRQGPVVLEKSRIHDNANFGVLAYASRNVIIRNNSLSNDHIYLKDGGRSPYRLTRLSVIDNAIQSGFIEADAAVVSDYRTKSLLLDGNVFVSCPTVYRWNLTAYTSLASVQSALGFEAHGKAK
jgi:hypothetical protein